MRFNDLPIIHCSYHEDTHNAVLLLSLFLFCINACLTLLCRLTDVEQGIRFLTNIFDAKTFSKRSKT